MRRFLLIALIGLSVAYAAPRKRPAEQEDGVSLAGLLVREGEWERAATAIAAVDTKAKGVDLPRYWTLRGLVELHERRAAEAATSFRAALATATEGRELLELHLARALLAAEVPDEALAALERAGDVGASLPGTWLLRASACEAAGRTDDAWSALDAGAERFPDQPELRRQQVFLLVRLGLFREARARGEALLARPDADADDAVAISEALRRGGETREALTILEAALLEEGEDRDLLVQAARASLDDAQPRNAGRFLERATILDSALALEAAEAYRRGGDLDAALRMNGQVADPAAKARQRLGLLIEEQGWERAVALEPRLVRAGLTKDDGIAYGLAYSWFRLGEHAHAERWLRDIREPAAFRRATELREAMAACERGGGCL
ncbi:MAG: tetratricopeptide repeat protein [Pseudomonadota bacterium]|nr:tetratricopeptide repeat protein [Pseudomonadota bacterium]